MLDHFAEYGLLVPTQTHSAGWHDSHAVSLRSVRAIFFTIRYNIDYVKFFEDERGVSEVVGFILLFGFIIILMSVWQAQVVPAENSKTEFKHYTGGQGEMSELRSDYIDAAETGTKRSVTIKLGTTFPTRILFINRPPPQGQIHTEMPSNGTITASGFDVSRVCGLDSPVKTRSITFNTDYNHFSDSETPPYIFENTVVYTQTPDGKVFFESDQALVQGSTLNLYPLTSNTSHSGVEGKSIDFTGAETGEIEVSGPISVTLPTALSDEQWEELLMGEPNFGSAQQVDSQRVKIILSDASWNVRCPAVGAEQTPDVTDPPQIDSGGNGSTGVGEGSVTDYGESSSSDTFSSVNGRWIGITCTDQLLLSDGQPASKPNGDNLQGDVIRLSGFLNDSTGESYTIDIKLARATDGSWNEKEVIIYDGNDNNVNAELTAAAATRIYEGGETDMLELSSYDDPDTGSGSFSDFVEQIRALDNDAPVAWQTSRMTGRVTVAFECDSPPAPPASGVSTIDGTTPSSESSAVQFDLQIASSATKTVTDVGITTPGNQNSNVESADQLKRGSGTEVRLTVPDTSGVNQSGELNKNVKLDGTEYSLDTNAVFSDGAVLEVDMGDIERGDTNWTYDLANSQSEADVVVTFYFQDDTQFQAYLEVTNVNS